MPAGMASSLCGQQQTNNDHKPIPFLAPCNLSLPGTVAEGTCMTAFTWNAGGTWQGQAWTGDLPTDAALLFYLFAAFLDAPRSALPLPSPSQWTYAHTFRAASKAESGAWRNLLPCAVLCTR